MSRNYDLFKGFTVVTIIISFCQGYYLTSFSMLGLGFLIFLINSFLDYKLEKLKEKRAELEEDSARLDRKLAWYEKLGGKKSADE